METILFFVVLGVPLIAVLIMLAREYAEMKNDKE